MAVLQVNAQGGAPFQSIQAAVDAAAPGDEIRIAPGAYQEAVTVATPGLSLIAEGDVTITNGGSFGLRVDAADVTLQGLTVRGISGEAFPSDHIATGIVVNAPGARLIGVTVHGNAHNGVLVTDQARDVRIEGGAVYDNSVAGIALGGGTNITIRGVELYSSGGSDAGDGRFQNHGILADNVGDTTLIDGEIRDIDGSQSVNGLVMEDLIVRDHPNYGIRIAVANEALSDLPSGRITSFDVTLRNSQILRNGADLDDFVGGLYHLGGVLIQHIDGALVEGNLFQDNFHWGLDAYAVNDAIYRDNYFLDNNAGAETPGVTFEPVALEVNGGARNIIEHNLITGSTAGLFSSYIPDGGDDFDGNASVTIQDNILFGNAEVDLEFLGGPDVFSRTTTNNVVGFMPEWLIDYITEDIDPGFLDNNFYGADPQFADPANGDYAPAPDGPAAGLGPRVAPLQAGEEAPSGDGFNFNALQDWTRVPGNPVLRDPVDAGGFEVASDPHVFVDQDGVLRMVYTGDVAGNASIWLATGADWATWETETALLSEVGPSGLDIQKETPFYRLAADGTHQLYYIGYPDGDTYEASLYLAESDSLFGPYEQRAEPIVALGDIAGRDVEVITSPSVVSYDGVLHLVFLGWESFPNPQEIWTFGATSTDGGATWTGFQELDAPIGAEGQVTLGPDGAYYAVGTGGEDGAEAILIARAEHPFGPYETLPDPILTQAGAPYETDQIIAAQLTFDAANDAAHLFYTGAEEAIGWWVMAATADGNGALNLLGDGPDASDVFRFFNLESGGHFFTRSAPERDAVLASGDAFRFEGVGFEALPAEIAEADGAGGAQPVFRFFNTETGGHFFTMSTAERDAVRASTPSYRFEGVGFAAFDQPDAAEGIAPVFRFFNTETGGHFFTISETERDAVLDGAPSYRFEGVGFYAFPASLEMTDASTGSGAGDGLF